MGRWTKPIAWSVCIVAGNILGNVVNKEYFGPLEGTVLGAVAGAFVTTWIDIQELERQQ